MRKITNYLLATTLSLGCAMSWTSCKDDDKEANPQDNNQTEVDPTDPYQKSSEKAMALYGLASQISGIDSLPNDWETAVLPSIYGEVLDNANPMVQTVAAESLAEAVLRWNSLTDHQLAADGTSDSWSFADLGSLTFTAGDQTSVIATIDVNIQQFKLTQIRFVSPENLGENAQLPTPYYQLGDVVQDKDQCYWICVRPAYPLKSKKHSHWISMHLTGDNIKHYPQDGEKGEEFVPTSLGKDPEMMVYFAELMQALANPDDIISNWSNSNAGKGDGFAGLGTEAFTTSYVRQLAIKWNEERIWNIITPSKQADDVAYWKEYFSGNELNMYYYGYSSPFSFSDMSLYYLKVTANNAGTLSKDAKSTISWSKKGNTFNIKDYFAKGTRGDNCTQGLEKAIVVRYRTYEGDLTKPLSWADRDVFLSSQKVVNNNITTDVSTKPGVGYLMGEDGNFYRTKSIAESKNVRPVALVLYVPEFDADENDKCLAVSLKPVGKAKFADIRDKNFYYYDDCKWKEFVFDWNKAYDNTKSMDVYEDMLTELDLVSNHTHPAAQLVSNYAVFGTEDFDHSKFNDCSQWYMPSLPDYLKITLCTGLKFDKDGQADGSGTNVTTACKKMEALIKAAGLSPNDVFPRTAMFLTTTYDFYNGGEVFKYNITNGGRVLYETSKEYDKEAYVQAFLSFSNKN